MPKCLKCDSHFPNQVKIEGKIRNLQSRKFCLSCSPFGQHNTKNLVLCERQNCDKKCPKCELTKPLSEFYKRRENRDSSVYCKICSSIQAIERQQSFKLKCTNYLGGKCIKCGYDKYVGALEFHHLDENKKEFNISQAKAYKFDKKIIKELEKCVLLCANCHREEHAKIRGIKF